MPIYEYACDKCGHEFEANQRITEDPIKTCPECRSRKLKKLISRTSFVLKGSGWYSDLYSSSAGKDAKDGKESTEGASAESKDTGDKSEKKKPAGDEKAASKSESKGKKGKSKKAAA